MGIEKSRLGRRFHGSLHIVIVDPDGADLLKRQHRVQLHPQGTSRVHPGEHQGWKPGLGQSAPQRSRHIR